MLGFLEKSIKLESNVLFSVVDFRMRKDASKLNNRGLKIDFVELDKGFSEVVSKIRKDASLFMQTGRYSHNCCCVSYLGAFFTKNCFVDFDVVFHVGS